MDILHLSKGCTFLLDIQDGMRRAKHLPHSQIVLLLTPDPGGPMVPQLHDSSNRVEASQTPSSTAVAQLCGSSLLKKSISAQLSCSQMAIDKEEMRRAKHLPHLLHLLHDGSLGSPVSGYGILMIP
jgi:hypothetical protein